MDELIRVDYGLVGDGLEKTFRFAGERFGADFVHTGVI